MFRTKRQRKTLCSTCPIAKVANTIGDPVTLMVIRELLDGPKRFGDLESSLAGASSRTLTNKLRDLQKNDLVKRREIPKQPPGVEYSLTKKGVGLHGITEAMKKYGEKYLS